ncbi:MAG: helix-turn-helix domain-containing protein [Bacteroidales bacterium]|nr:helix-turn-helix domain-containing protein [Bacteroidales bacterium]
MEPLTPIYEIAEEFSENTSRSLFLTGKAGTGKTTFLRNLRRHTQKQIAVVAPTGVAAINAGGVTIHSFFQLPFTPFVPTDAGRKNLIKKIKMTNVRRKVMQQLEILVIDEISMVRADLLDAVDTVLRHFRYRNDVPFGGVQVVYIGDLYQLPPVVVPEEWDLISQYYRSPFFFDSCVVQQQPPVYIELDKIFRQSNADFVNLLNEVRNNRLTENGFRMLQSRFEPNFKLSEHPDYIFLTTHNATANRMNKEEMDKLPGKTFRYEAMIEGEFSEKNYPNDPILELKEGAKVMFIANDGSYPRRYFNGRIGIVTHLDRGHIFVHCDDDEEDISVAYETWENIRYGVNRVSGQIEEKSLGSYTHFPLRLAWAITIHKSQGLTFDKAVIDAEWSFSSGQVYVALSRCRTLEGLVLKSPIRKESLVVEPSVVSYSQQKPSVQTLGEELAVAQLEYNELIVSNVFNFKFADGQAAYIQSLSTQHADRFNSEGIQHARKLRENVAALRRVADSFQVQIHQLFSTDEERLCQRLKDAAAYFKKELTQLIAQSCHSPAEIFDSEVSRDYKEGLKSLFIELHQKKHLIAGIYKDSTVQGYYRLRESFRIPSFSLKSEDIFSETEEKRLRKSRRESGRKRTARVPSYCVTLELYRSGKSISEIAEERNMALSTIENHIIQCVKEKKIQAVEIFNEEVVNGIRTLLENGCSIAEVLESTNGNFDYNQIRMIAAEME